MSDQNIEVDLLARAANRDEEALAALLERHAPALRDRIGASIGAAWRSSIEVDDVLQITWLEAFLQIDRLSSLRPESFASWLRHIADNNLKDAIRALEANKRPNPKRRVRAAAGQESSLVALVEMLGVTTTTPSRAAARDEAASLLEQALAALPDDYATVVRQYDLEGRPIEEIATALGRTPGAVYMLRARAHDRLKTLMGSPSQYFSQGA